LKTLISNYYYYHHHYHHRRCRRHPHHNHYYHQYKITNGPDQSARWRQSLAINICRLTFIQDNSSFDMVLPKIEAYIFTDIHLNIWSLLNSEVRECCECSWGCLQCGTEFCKCICSYLYFIISLICDLLFWWSFIILKAKFRTSVIV
jgi:hypothetical protein